MIYIKFFILRVGGESKEIHHWLYNEAPALVRFRILMEGIEAVLALAKQPQAQNTLFVIASPEGTVSSHRLTETHCSEAEYLNMAKYLFDLMKDVDNVLLMPGTFTYPHPHLKKMYMNPLLIIYQNNSYEYFQRYKPSVKDDEGKPFFKHIFAVKDMDRKFNFSFRGIPFVLYPQICIDHKCDSLHGIIPQQKEKNSLQVIVSNTIQRQSRFCRASVVVQADDRPHGSSVVKKDMDSIFYIQTVNSELFGNVILQAKESHVDYVSAKATQALLRFQQSSSQPEENDHQAKIAKTSSICSIKD